MPRPYTAADLAAVLLDALEAQLADRSGKPTTEDLLAALPAFAHEFGYGAAVLAAATAALRRDLKEREAYERSVR
jgi:hypothetical protein